MSRGAARLVPLAALLVGCATSGRLPTPLERAVAEAAAPLLTMDPHAVWTRCYNRLVELAPDSIAYLAEHPNLSRPVAPDDLPVLLHASLVRLLVHPAQRPRLTATCFETTLDVLHFELKVNGHRIGTVCLTRRQLPRAWHDLYPAEFDHLRAARVDAEADRRAIRQWWAGYRDRPHVLVAAPPLRPRSVHLWPLLARRRADRWSYLVRPRAIRCAGPEEPALLHAVTYDYNLTRAACIWLGAAGDSETRGRLIELVGNPAPVVAHNALFALAHDPDPRIRDLIERYNKTNAPRPPSDQAGPIVHAAPSVADRQDAGT